MNISALLTLAAVVLLVVAAVLFWPVHAAALACIGLACWAAASLVGVFPLR